MRRVCSRSRGARVGVWFLLVSAAVLAAGCGATRFEARAQQSFDRAGLLLSAGKVGPAERELRQAVGLTMLKADAYITSVRMLYDEVGRPDSAAVPAAARFARELIDLSDRGKLDRDLQRNELESVMVLYAGLMYKLHRDDEAARILERTIARWPNDANALNDVGYTYADAGANLNRALELTRKAVRLAPRNGLYTDSLGWAYFKLGRKKDALRELRRAVALAPDEAELRLHLGIVFASLGMRDQAEIELEKARALPSTARVRQEASEFVRKLRTSPRSDR